MWRRPFLKESVRLFLQTFVESLVFEAQALLIPRDVNVPNSCHLEYISV